MYPACYTVKTFHTTNAKRVKRCKFSCPIGWLYSETNGYEKVFFVAGGSMVLTFLLICPVHCLSKAPPDMQTVNAVIVDGENVEESVEMTNKAEKNVLLLSVRNNDLESDFVKVESSGSNDTDELDKILKV